MIIAILSWLVCAGLKEPSYISVELLLAPLPAAIVLMGVINLLLIRLRRSRVAPSVQRDAEISDPGRKSASSHRPPRD